MGIAHGIGTGRFIHSVFFNKPQRGAMQWMPDWPTSAAPLGLRDSLSIACLFGRRVFSRGDAALAPGYRSAPRWGLEL